MGILGAGRGELVTRDRVWPQHDTAPSDTYAQPHQLNLNTASAVGHEIVQSLFFLIFYSFSLV